MSFLDQINNYKNNVATRITNKSLPESISLNDESLCFTDLVDLLAQFAYSDPIHFLSTDAWPLVIPDFSNTFAVAMPVPSIVIRQLVSGTYGTSNAVYDIMENIRPRYDVAADTLTIDVIPFEGDITIKK